MIASNMVENDLQKPKLFFKLQTYKNITEIILNLLIVGVFDKNLPIYRPLADP